MIFFAFPSMNPLWASSEWEYHITRIKNWQSTQFYVNLLRLHWKTPILAARQCNISWNCISNWHLVHYYLLHRLSNLLYALKTWITFSEKGNVRVLSKMGMIFFEDLNFLKRNRNFLQTAPKWRFSKRKFHEVFVLNLPVKWGNQNYKLTFDLK